MAIALYQCRGDRVGYENIASFTDLYWQMQRVPTLTPEKIIDMAASNSVK
jgi:hypothetical protein